MKQSTPSGLDRVGRSAPGASRSIGAPNISVIIPAYNNARYVGQAIESVLNQTHPALEIIVVDDGSTDDTSQVLERFGDRIRAVRQENAGVAAARNYGARLARGELLAFLDADDVWLPEKLQRQVDEFLQNPGLGFVTCGMYEVDKEGAVIGTLLDGRGGWVAEDLALLRPTVVGPGSTMMVPSDVFQSVGGYDHLLPPSEDWDLAFRIACSHEVGFVREPLANYRIHGTNAHLNPERFERGLIRAWEKTFRDPASPVHHLRREAYGNLYIVLAGAFFQARQWRRCVSYALRSLVLTPGNAERVIKLPVRRWRMRKSGLHKTRAA